MRYVDSPQIIIINYLAEMGITPDMADEEVLAAALRWADERYGTDANAWRWGIKAPHPWKGKKKPLPIVRQAEA